jgi:hypothetical protein
VVGVLLGAAVLLGGPAAGPAHACSCVGWTEEQAFASADAVFRGQVTGYQSPVTEGGFSSLDPAIWTFAVSEVYKGDVAPSQQILSPFSGASCGLEIPKQGEFFVFASRRGIDGQVSGDQYHANLCGGTRSTSAGPLAVQALQPEEEVTTVPPPPTTAAPQVEPTVPVTRSPATTTPPAPSTTAAPQVAPTTQVPDATLEAASVAAETATADDGTDRGPVLLVVATAVGALLGATAYRIRSRRRAAVDG